VNISPHRFKFQAWALFSAPNWLIEGKWPMHRIHLWLVWVKACASEHPPWVPWWHYSPRSMSGDNPWHKTIFLCSFYLTGLARLFPSYQGAAVIIPRVLPLQTLATPLSSCLERQAHLTSLSAEIHVDVLNSPPGDYN
jgi:hypothetical protein